MKKEKKSNIFNNWMIVGIKPSKKNWFWNATYCYLHFWISKFCLKIFKSFLCVLASSHLTYVGFSSDLNTTLWLPTSAIFLSYMRVDLFFYFYKGVKNNRSFPLVKKINQIVCIFPWIDILKFILKLSNTLKSYRRLHKSYYSYLKKALF